MSFMNWIVDRLNDVSNFFYQLYLDCFYVGWPLEVIGYWFYYLSDTFSRLAWNFYDFSSWVTDVQVRVSEILDTWDIWTSFQWWFEAAENAWNWVSSAAWNIWYEVEDWWGTTQYTVQGWIDEARWYAYDLVAGVNTWLAELQSAWDDFKGRIPTIDQVIYWWSNWTGNVSSVINTWWTATMVEVQDLINSAFIIRSDFWAGWQDWRDKVTEFFTDPEDWLYKSADRIIERFW